MTTKTKTPVRKALAPRVTMTRVLDFARSHNACNDAQAWLASAKTPKAAWESCERGDWLLWLVARLLPKDRWMPFVYEAADRAVREYAPAALDASGRADSAATLRALPRICDRETALKGRAAAAAAAYAAAAAAADAARKKELKRLADSVRKQISVAEVVAALRSRL